MKRLWLSPSLLSTTLRRGVFKTDRILSETIKTLIKNYHKEKSPILILAQGLSNSSSLKGLIKTYRADRGECVLQIDNDYLALCPDIVSGNDQLIIFFEKDNMAARVIIKRIESEGEITTSIPTETKRLDQ